MEDKKKSLLDRFKIQIVGLEYDPVKEEKFKASLTKYLEDEIINEGNSNGSK